MKQEEMVIGGYYYIWDQNYWMLGKVIRLGGRGNNATWSNLISTESEFREDCNWSVQRRQIREATSEEIEWLDACIREKKWLPKEKANPIVNNYSIF